MKNAGLGNENLEKFGSRARILTKTWLKIKKNSKIENGGHKSGALTVRLGGAATDLKKGGHDRGTPPYPFPM